MYKPNAIAFEIERVVTLETPTGLGFNVLWENGIATGDMDGERVVGFDSIDETFDFARQLIENFDKLADEETEPGT